MLQAREIKDRVAVGDDCFILENLGNGKVRLIPSPDVVAEPGTDVNRALLQPIEERTVFLMNTAHAMYESTAILTGTVWVITSLMVLPTDSLFTVRFIAPEDYAAGEGLTVNGEAYTLTGTNGKPLGQHAWCKDSIVQLVMDPVRAAAYYNAIGDDLDDHNVSEQAHSDIRQKIGTDITVHNNAAQAHQTLFTAKQNAPIYATVTMAASGWQDNTYSFETAYPHASYDIEIALDVSATTEQVKSFNKSSMVGSGVSNVVTAKGTVPTVDIPILVKVVSKV